MSLVVRLAACCRRDRRRIRRRSGCKSRSTPRCSRKSFHDAARRGVICVRHVVRQVSDCLVRSAMQRLHERSKRKQAARSTALGEQSANSRFFLSDLTGRQRRGPAWGLGIRHIRTSSAGMDVLARCTTTPGVSAGTSSTRASCTERLRTGTDARPSEFRYCGGCRGASSGPTRVSADTTQRTHRTCRWRIQGEICARVDAWDIPQESRAHL